MENNNIQNIDLLCIDLQGYELQSIKSLGEKIKTVKFKGVNWNVEFEPTVAAIQRLKMQASANAEEPNFTVATNGSDLISVNSLK